MLPRYTLHLTVLLFLLLFPFLADAQRVLGAFSLGMNITQVDGDEFYGFHKVGLNVGPQVILPFGKNKNFSVSMELLYSQKGSVHRGSSDTTNFRMELDYVEIPVIVKFTDKKVVSGGVGFSYGQLVNYRETQNRFFDTLFTYQSSLANNDISVIADVQFRIWSRLWGNVRYQYSLRSLRTVLVDDPRYYPRNPYTREQYNNVISIRLTWVFNQPKTQKGGKIELKEQE